MLCDTVNVVCVINDTRVSKWLCESCAKEFAAEGVMAGQKGENARNILEEFFKPLRRLKSFLNRCAGWRKRITTQNRTRRIIFIQIWQKRFWLVRAGQLSSASRKKLVQNIFCGRCCRNRRARQHICCCGVAWINIPC